MKKNIAILMGNSKYSTLGNLECCLSDVASMRELLDGCNKFAEIFEYKDVAVDAAKDQLRQLSTDIKGADELFFYFSGHGHSDASDFFMCFKDFSADAPNTSGLSRNDLHDILRSFDASLVVNIIDACNSGRNLIKADYEPITKQANFKTFIQFAACMGEQHAFTGEPLSAFTHEFRLACLRKASGPVYYTDVESCLRDAFVGNGRQTPYFIKQGTSQEIFCADASSLNTIRERVTVEHSRSIVPAVSVSPISEFEAARQYLKVMEKEVPSSKDAQGFIEAIADHVMDISGMEGGLDDFFDCRVARFDDYEQVGNKKAIVRLLDGRPRDDTFVGSGTTREKRRESYYGALSSFMYAPIYDEFPYLDNNCQLKNVHVRLYFEPKFMNLKRLLAEIVFLPSLLDCLVLTATNYERRSGWGSFRGPEEAMQWKWSECRWSDAPHTVAQGLRMDPLAVARSYIGRIAETAKSTF